MFWPTTSYSKDAKVKNAEKLKEDKRRWKAEKLQREREASDYLKRKNQELNDLEQAFLEELGKRKPKKGEVKVERFFYVKKKKVDLPTFTSRVAGNYVLHGAESDNNLISSSATLSTNTNPHPHAIGKVPVPSSFNSQGNSKLVRLDDGSQGNLSVPGSLNPRSNNKLIRSDDGSQASLSNKLTSGYSSSPFSDLEKNKFMLNPNSTNTVSNSDLAKNSNSSSPTTRVRSKPGLNLKNEFDSKLNFLKPAASKDLSPDAIDEKTEDLAQWKEESNLSERKKMIEKRQKKFLPLILRPVNNEMFTVHIVGENNPGKVMSQNNTPLRGEDETGHSPYFHMFRDIEVINKSSKALPVSKVRAMRDYDKEVKRFYTPKPNINHNLRLESKRLEKYLENTVKRIKFLKIFK